jgi:hypothetical protein
MRRLEKKNEALRRNSRTAGSSSTTSAILLMRNQDKKASGALGRTQVTFDLLQRFASRDG